ncbi:MAG TPA: hypothetical protein VKT82_01555 [Ktedonobacterales bacterium]|nr:hypothetical protein [Ktedonobacterales bacterium]
MAMATCWKCGAQVIGPTCQRCGAAQQPGAGAAQGQPVVGQASMSARSPQPPGGGYAAGGQYPSPQANQPGGWQGQQPAPGQGAWQTPPPAPGQGNWQGYPQQPAPGYPQPGYQGPSAYQQQQVAMGGTPAMPGAKQQAPLNPLALLLGLVGGGVAAVIGALAWAFFLELTKTNFYLSGVLLGILVGAGVALGARGQNRFVLAIMGAVLGLLCFFLALYFRLSLATADVLGTGTNLFALPFSDFFDVLKLYLQDNPLNYANFVAVPLLAALTAFNNTLTRRRLRRSF